MVLDTIYKTQQCIFTISKYLPLNKNCKPSFGQTGCFFQARLNLEKISCMFSIASEKSCFLLEQILNPLPKYLLYL